MKNNRSSWTRLVYIKISLCVLLIIISGRTYTAPLNLNCSISNENEHKKFHVSLNKATQHVLHTLDDGKTISTTGYFSENTISYQQSLYSSNGILELVLKYSINSSSLTVIETFSTEIVDSDMKSLIPKKAAKKILTVTIGNCVAEQAVAQQTQSEFTHSDQLDSTHILSN